VSPIVPPPTPSEKERGAPGIGMLAVLSCAGIGALAFGRRRG
jgi:hypothetical protein